MSDKRPSDSDLELSFYEKFLFSKGLEPYPVQEQAITHIFAGESVLVTVPTGTGKTLMAKAALHRGARPRRARDLHHAAARAHRGEVSRAVR